jgi:hypothetical protein
MATITERTGPRGKRYLARVRFRGRVETKTFRTKTEAKDWARQLEASADAPPSAKTLSDAIDRYKREVLPGRGAVMQQDQATQLAWWTRHYGSRKLSGLTPAVLDGARMKLADKPKTRGTGTLSAASVNRYLAAVSAVLHTAARRWNWMPAAPAVPKMKEPRGRVRFIEGAELRALLDAARGSDSPCCTCISYCR